MDYIRTYIDSFARIFLSRENDVALSPYQIVLPIIADWLQMRKVRSNILCMHDS